MNNCLYFDFYGVGLRVECFDTESLDNIKRDFFYFLKKTLQNIDIKINIFLEKPPFEKVPSLKSSLYNPDSIVYDDKDLRYVDHHEKALTIYDYKSEVGKIYSLDKMLLHELSYLLILSRVGEFLDKKGIHRIHALGISIPTSKKTQKAVLCLLPQGAGKTTLALELLKDEQIRLLSDDAPLITSKGKILAFPLRLAVPEGFFLDIPPQYLRNFQRRKYGNKTLIDIEYFKDKIVSFAEPSIILIGERISSCDTKIFKIMPRPSTFLQMALSDLLTEPCLTNVLKSSLSLRNI